MKHQSMEYQHKELPEENKLKSQSLASKVMATVFWDAEDLPQKKKMKSQFATGRIMVTVFQDTGGVIQVLISLNVKQST